MKRHLLIPLLASFFTGQLDAATLEKARISHQINGLQTPSIMPDIEKRIQIYPEPRPEEEIPLIKKIKRLRFDMATLRELVKERSLTQNEMKLQEPGKALDITLPFESRLNIQGRKMVRVRYGGAHYIDRVVEEDKKTPPPPTSLAVGTRIDQELQARVHGVVKEKIHVDIDYDDTRKERQQRFWIAYKGDPDEIVQEAAFGDLTLSLPTTTFVAYSKSLFGAKADLKMGELRLVAIGSRTKGITEKKEFKGRAIQQIRDIPDTGFIQRKYYQLFGNIPKWRRDLLPISDLEVYIDDKDGSNDTGSTITLTAISHDSVDSYQGRFDKQNPFEDYVVNHQTGVLTFRKTIRTNHVIALTFKDKHGRRHPGTGYLMIKPDPVDFPFITKEERRKRYGVFELKGYYSLGHTEIDLTDPDFLLQIRNMNKENRFNGRSYIWIFGLDRDNDGRIDQDYIDTRLGIVSFPANTPFDLIDHPDNEEDPSYRDDINRAFPSIGSQESISNTNLYDVTSPTPRYHIHIEYKTFVKEYFLRPFIVEGTERVYVDGVRRERDIDYLIDYESGWITFIGGVRIDEDTKIKVEYEYMPFGGRFQKTLFGTRLEYKPSDLFGIGSTYVYEGATTPESVPDITATPDSLQVINLDTQIRAFGIIKEAFGLDVPLEVDIQAEVARSLMNPNLFGAAMIHSMQGVETAHSVSMDHKGWGLGFGHNGILLYKDRAYGEMAGPYNEEEGHLKDDKVKGKERSLVLSYELGQGERALVVSCLSKTGLDLSGYRELEVWTKGIRGERVYIDLGILNEDRDGDGRLDKEDLNGDGILNLGEDVGWEFNPFNAKSTRVGVGNGELDTEDFDGDGRLNSTLPTWRDEGYFEIELKDRYRREGNPDTTEPGWILYKVPLKDAIPKGEFSGIGDRGWTLIKHIRIRIEGEGTGKISIDSIQIIGNRWEKGTIMPRASQGGRSYFDVSGANSEDDPEYIDLKDDNEFKGLYKGKDLDELKEEALIIDYLLEKGEIGSTRYIYKRPNDYSRYRMLRFWLYGDGNGVDFFIRFGADEGNYFGERIKVDFHGWRLIQIDLRRSKDEWIRTREYKGNPYMSNIRYIQLGIYGNGSGGKIMVNEIHLSHPEVIQGNAHRVNAKISWSDWLSVGLDKKVVESDFLSIGMTSPQQDIITQGFSLEFSKVKWLPMSYSWSSSMVETDPEKVRDVITSDLGKRYEEKGLFGARFLLDRWPRLTCTYEIRDADISYEGRRRLEDEEIFTGHLSHTLKIPLGHRFEVSPSYKQIASSKITTYPESRKRDLILLTRTHDGELELRVDPVPTLLTTSSIGLRETLKYEESEVLKDKDYRPQKRGLNGGFSIEYKGIKGVLPGIEGSGGFDETYSYTHGMVKKGVGSSMTSRVKTRLYPKEWSAMLGFIDLDHAYTLDVKANYSDLPDEGTWDTISKVYHDYYKGAHGDTISQNRTSASTTRRNTYRANLYIWNPLSLSTSYTVEVGEFQSQSSITFRDSKGYEVLSRLRLDEAIGLFRRITTSSHLITKYKVKEDVVREISKTIVTSQEVNWQANWGPRFRTIMGVGFSWTNEEKRKDVRTERSITPNLSLNHWRERPIVLGLPFIKRKIRLEQRLEWDLTIGVKFKERVETRIPKVRSKSYNIGVGIKYDIQRNMRGILGLKGEYFDDELGKGNDFYAYEGSLEIEFRF